MTQYDPNSVLQLYGLDQALTDQDDPRLWAAVLTKHWPRPEDPDLFVAGLIFSIAETPHDREHLERSGMAPVETWYFERTDAKHLKAVRNKSEARYPRRILEISRPSANATTAFVHMGGAPGPFMGRGEIRVWARQEDGGWAETEEVVSMWIA
ncbi:MAG: hypothetical protein KJZ93_17910 [Caldilineaceae bacterium]|nr:hypothetical protein [Caldilineaceae bacterium]